MSAVRRALGRPAALPPRPQVERHAGAEGEPDFLFVDPPFYVNSGKFAHIPQEVAGNYLLRSLLLRLGWPSLAGRAVVDWGCGVRIARTILNLGHEVGRYHGVDVNRPLIEWLGANVDDPRFVFSWVDDRNPLYNPGGMPGGGLERLRDALAARPFDLAYAYSLITHCAPEEASRIFATLRRIVRSDGALSFTAFIDDELPGHAEAGEAERVRVVYSTDALRALLEPSGWRIERVYRGTFIQQPALLCRPIEPAG